MGEGWSSPGKPHGDGSILTWTLVPVLTAVDSMSTRGPVTFPLTCQFSHPRLIGDFLEIIQFLRMLLSFENLQFCSFS